MTKMKAVVVSRYGGPEVLEMREVPRPLPGPGQVLIAVAGTSVNFADIMAREGRYHAGSEPPFIPGLEVVGEVAAVGSGVNQFAPGTAVMAFPASGSYAQWTVADARLTFPLPAPLNPRDVQGLPLVGLTSYYLAVKAGRVAPGEKVLIHAAAGGVGSLLIQVCRLLGVGMVIGSVGRTEKVPAAKNFGCDEVVVRDQDYMDRVRAMTSGHGPDVIFNALGGPEVEWDSALLAPFGRLVVYGEASGNVGQATSRVLYPKNASMIGFSFGHLRRWAPERIAPAAQAVLAWRARGFLDVPVGARFSLTEAALAQKAVASGQSTGKIVLDL